MMTKLMISSDQHLSHKNITNFRPRFKTVEEHDETILENLRMGVNKADSLLLLGDVAFTPDRLQDIKDINCRKKTLVLGNHCTDQKIPFHMYLEVFDAIHSLHSRRNVWFSHAPIHPSVMRGRKTNIHGHTHEDVIYDERYINVCVEQTDYKPISFEDALSRKVKW